MADLALTPAPSPPRRGAKLPFSLGEKGPGDEGANRIELN